MQINYRSESFFLYQYTLAGRHIQAAFTSDPEKLFSAKVLSVKLTTPPSLLNRVYHLVFALANFSLPIIGLVVSFADRFFNDFRSLNVSSKVLDVIEDTPPFESYKYGNGKSVREYQTRPANLFYKAVFGSDPTTQPGSGKIFGFKSALSAIRSTLMSFSKNEVFSLKAEGVYTKPDLMGSGTYKISAGEIQEMLNSQKIYVSPLIPKAFYMGFKKALQDDKQGILPGSDWHPLPLKEILSKNTSYWVTDSSTYYLEQFLKKVEKNPSNYGFHENSSSFSFNELKEMTLYQIGSMIVKTESYRTFVEDSYRIENREVGAKDDILLINACGIRGFHSSNRSIINQYHRVDQKIMKETFKTALKSAGKDAAVVFPAVGMGIWGGDPDVYWRAFFEAVIEAGSDVGEIYVNPGHQKTKINPWKGYSGEEFASILKEYTSRSSSNENLEKVVNLYDRKTDLVLFSKNLKKAFPEKTIALFNASDPDVTLGNHVGEYVNDIDCHSTTEENYTAIGTNGLMFEEVTGVHKDPKRVIQT